MLPVRPRPQFNVDMIGETGWVLYDFTPSAGGPQWSFVAGSAQATRVMLDRFRRDLIFTAAGYQLQFWCWASVDFRLVDSTYTNNIVSGQTLYFPDAFPQSITLPASFVPHELDAYQSNVSGTLFVSARFNNDAPTTSHQMTIAGRYHLNATISGTNATYRRASFSFPTTSGPIRCLIVGHHNTDWGSVTP